MLLKFFTEHFKQSYGVECVAALHHNKRKTNYHIHLIFAERKLLNEPIIKVASRNMFFDENGKHVRTKKEILDEAGQVRDGCRIILKGEAYEKNIFTKKDSRFKNAVFLDEIKHSYTNLINVYEKDDKEKLKVFEKGSVYLPMKKIGKNNPKEQKIRTDNQQRVVWNQTVDRALISGVSEEQILGTKQMEIGKKVQASIQKEGRDPENFKNLIREAICRLELLIGNELKKTNTIVDLEKQRRGQNVSEPIKSKLVSKYLRLEKIYRNLEQQNCAIYAIEQKITILEGEIVKTKGIFKGKQRKELQEQVDQLKGQIINMKQHLSQTVQNEGYENVKAFLKEYNASKVEYDSYKKKVKAWEYQTGSKAKSGSIMDKLQQKTSEMRKNKGEKIHERL